MSDARWAALAACALLACGGSESQSQGTGGGGAAPLPIESVETLAVGALHSCVVAQPGGRVVCWGANTLGQTSSVAGSNAEAPLFVPGIEDAAYLRLGETDSCAVRQDGSFRCWGEHDFTAGGRMLGAIEELAVGGSQTCAVVSGGEVHCWSASESDPHVTTPPEPVALPSSATALALGNTHACALLDSSQVWCWGSNASGQLGDPAVSDRGPVQVVNLDDAVAIATAVGGGAVSTCAVRASGAVACWGKVPYQTDAITAGAEDAAFTDPALSVRVGNAQVCAVHQDGSASCLPDDACLPSSHAAGRELDLRNGHACVLGGETEVRCFGDDEFGQLGSGQTSGVCNASGVEVLLPEP